MASVLRGSYTAPFLDVVDLRLRKLISAGGYTPAQVPEAMPSFGHRLGGSEEGGASGDGRGGPEREGGSG